MAEREQPEKSDGNTFLIGLLLTTLVLGILVVAVKSDYRIDQNLISNEDYYSNVTVGDESDEAGN
ncbi:MAG TPA: hypothetical protein PLP29_00825 [Candidatus Ozemobacteraceae bacterium]|nr:hypothetical protein [Candidatus Ozemobacteraceae bacterium]